MDDSFVLRLQEKLGYFFNDSALLIKSLTHSSYANENKKKGMESNERLEFLGDSLLGMAVALLIFESKPYMSEGQMTKLRSELVCEKSLAALATTLDLGFYLRLGKGEDSGGGRSRPSILADAFEAVLAAIYLDGGLEPAHKFVSKILKDSLDNIGEAISDYKTLLQEIIQLKPTQSHIYELADEQGPDHDKTFTVNLKLNGMTIGTGIGKSKKSAEQEAAKAALEKIST
jgi:ribonuclease-3